MYLSTHIQVLNSLEIKALPKIRAENILNFIIFQM